VTQLKPQIRCREIAASDIDAVADLLTRGFVGRARDYWLEGLQRQAARGVPQGYPRFGYMLDHEGTPVGVLLLLYATRGTSEALSIYCNLSSWYVEPRFRNYAPMLTSIAQRLKEVTYFNISPAHWTWPIIEAQGFSTYCRGLFFSLPLLSPLASGMHAEVISADAAGIDGLSDDEAEILKRHAAYGWLSLVCRGGGRAYPFVLTPMRIRRGLFSPPAMQLIYCRQMSEFIACAGAIGRALLRRGKISVIVDANGPVDGLRGVYTEKRGRKYFKGPNRPRLGDLSDTELVVYGP
jgi:hypothetical protein